MGGPSAGSGEDGGGGGGGEGKEGDDEMMSEAERIIKGKGSTISSMLAAGAVRSARFWEEHVIQRISNPHLLSCMASFDVLLLAMGGGP